MLKFLKDLLSEGELLPSSHYEVKKLLKGLGLRVDDLGLRCERYLYVRMIVFYFGRINKIYKHVQFVIQADGKKVVVRIRRKRKYHARFCGTFRLHHDCGDCSCRGILLVRCDGIRR